MAYFVRAVGAAATTMVVSFAFADVFHVNKAIGAPGDGSSWAVAMADLQLALAAASPGDEIWVAAGVYTPDGPGGDQALSFDLAAGVEVYGGFAGDEETRNERSWTENVTILSGDLNGDDSGGGSTVENSRYVVNASAGDLSAVLDGLQITGGNA